MSRKIESHERIVRAAIALFSRQSYHGTSVREIARLADVNELTVFRHFDNKEAIFHAALESCISGVTTRIRSIEMSGENDSPEVILRRIISIFVDISEFSPEVVRLIAIAILEGNGKAHELCRKHLGPVFLRIHDYLEAQRRTGGIETSNPTIATAAMVLSIVAQPELSRIVGDLGLLKQDIRESIQMNTRFWVDALRA